MPAADEGQARLEERLRHALAERDLALAALALAREELDAFRQALRRQGEPAPELYPPSAGVPLRHVLVDRANERAKALLGPLHGLARRLWTR